MEPNLHTPEDTDRATTTIIKPELATDVDGEHVNEEEKRTEYKLLTLDNYRQVAEEEQGLVPLEYSDDESMRAFYVNRTEELIAKAVSGGYDTMVFLDKSARPVAWMMREMWEMFAPGEKLPDFKFVNFDSSDWAGRGGADSRPTAEEMRDVVVPDEAIEELRGIFSIKEAGSQHSMMEDKKILVVDEISTTGTTLSFANDVIHRAFPEAEEIEPYAWMHATFVRKAHGFFPKEIPVWYHRKKEEGRGVGDRRPGSYWLSRSFERPDSESLQLRDEIRQLAKDVRDGLQPIIPDGNLDDPRYAGMKIRQVGEQQA